MYKAGRQNHDFQIAHFLVGGCHTADAAYALLKDQWEDRNNAIKGFEASQMRAAAKRLDLKEIINNKDSRESDKMRAQADLMDMDSMVMTNEKNLNAAIDERAFIEKCIERLKPYRKYKDLPDDEAAQAAQRDEWRLELMERAENFLITQGTIPHDHYATMRKHPDFEQIIHPYIGAVRNLLVQKNMEAVLNLKSAVGRADVVAYLGLTYEPRPALSFDDSNTDSLGRKVLHFDQVQR